MSVITLLDEVSYEGREYQKFGEFQFDGLPSPNSSDLGCTLHVQVLSMIQDRMDESRGQWEKTHLGS
jgi:hypothetical protein